MRRTSRTNSLTRTRYNDAGRTFPAAREAERSFGGSGPRCRLATTCARHVGDALPAGHGGRWRRRVHHVGRGEPARTDGPDGAGDWCPVYGRSDRRGVGADRAYPLGAICRRRGRGCDASAQTYTELLSVGTDARALPVPWLSPPDVPTQDLATAMVDIIVARPDVPPDVVSQELCARFPGHSLSQNRTLQLAVDFGIDLSAQMVQRLLDRMAHHFGHLTHVEPSAIVAFLADQLGEWKRRPSLIRHGAARNLYRPRH